MTPPATSCWHCGSPLPATGTVTASIGGKSRPLCCPGCRAAATWIDELGLADYYRLRSEPALKPVGNDEDRKAWNRPEIARHVVRDLGGGRREVMLLIDGVRCAACVWLIERALQSLPDVVSVQVNAASRRGRVIWADGATTLPHLLEALARAGYRALPLDARAVDDTRRNEARAALKRLVVAGFGAMQAMMYAPVVYLGGVDPLDATTHELFRWLGFLAATPVVFYAAQPFFAGARRSLAARRLGMDVPIALAIGLIYAASLIEALRGGGQVYFDSVSMFVFFLLSGRYIEMRARHHAGDLTDALARLAPVFAERIGVDGRVERIGIHELTRGDCVLVGEGSVVPADGVLLSERCLVDEALLSGESAPLGRQRGETLIAGSVLVDGPVQLKIERTGPDTVLAGIAALVERAQTERPHLAQAGERAAAHFIAFVLVATVMTVVGWSFVDPARAFTAALAVLVISCPCALALAVPVAFTRALAVLARRGVLVVRPDAIQSLAAATHVIFDKTGTLTEPQLALAGVETFGSRSREASLALAGCLARFSHHPVARAIASTSTAASGTELVDVSAEAGLGISGVLAGRRLRLGRPDFALAGRDVPPGYEDAVMLADEDSAIAAFRLSERLRPGARAAVEALRAQGLQILLASGDSADKVAAVAAQLGITAWRARQLPADKLTWLSELRVGGASVMAVGDGVNDAPVLAAADTAVAVARGAELAQATSDLVLAGEHLEALAPARAIAHQTMKILGQNQRWALYYNLVAVPLAALGVVPAPLAALGMSLSSLGVILNAMRIGREMKPGRAALASVSSTHGAATA